MFLCTGETIVNASAYEGEVHALRCKRWSCPHCRLINRKKVIHHGKNGIPNLFLTLTVKSSNYPDPVAAARDMIRGLVLLRRRIERHWKRGKPPFLCVFEAHKSGFPHMHLLLRAPYMDQKVLSRMWEEITGAFKVDIRAIKTIGQALFYVTKYIGKDLHKFEGCKRWWRSHDYNVLTDERPQQTMYGRGFIKFPVAFTQMQTAIRILQLNVEELAPDKWYYRVKGAKALLPGDIAALAASQGRAHGR